MHELSIAQSIKSGVEQVAKENNANKVTRVVVDIGVLSGVMKDSLEFCFPIACKGSILEDSQIDINEIPLKIRCDDCDQELIQLDCIVQCPKCESTTVEIVAGKEMKIIKIDFN